MAATNTITIGARNLVHLISTFYPSPLLEKGQVSKVTVVLRTENATTVLFLNCIDKTCRSVFICRMYTTHIICISLAA